MTREGTVPAPVTLNRTIVDLNRILRNIAESREYLRRPGVAVTIDLSGHLPNVFADIHQIEHVLLNLIANAVDAVTGDLGRPGKVHLKTAVQGERILVIVTDNGRGIRPQDMAGLLEDESKVVGLSICAEMVKDNGGDLYAWSSNGKGSAFTMELPIHLENEREAARLSQASERRRLHGKHILVIDDDVHITALLLDILSTQGAHVDLANSAVQAVDQIKSNRYDLLICDQWMPDLSGERLYRLIESTNPELRNRFVFVTGDVVSDEIRAFFVATGVRYLQKPFRTVELVEAVDQVLNRNR